MSISIPNERKKSSMKRFGRSKSFLTINKFFSLQYKVVVELFREKNKWTIGLIIFSLLIDTIGLIEVEFLKGAIDSVNNYYNKSGDFIDVLHVFSVFFALLLVLRILTSAYNVVREKYDSYFSFLIDKKITDKISKISYEYFESVDYYDRINLATKASVQYPNAIYGLTQLINIITCIVIYGYILTKINVIFIITALLSIIIGAILSIVMTDAQLRLWKKKVSPEERKNSYFNNIFSNGTNQSSIQIKNAYLYFKNKYHTHNKKTRTEYIKLNFISMITEFVVAILFILSLLYTAIYVAKGVVNGSYTLGYYSMTIAALTMLYANIKKFVKYAVGTNWYVHVLEAYYEVLLYDERDISCNTNAEAAIRVSGVSYVYPQTKSAALKNIDFKMHPREKVAIVGCNGSGKTTFVSLILGLLQQRCGSITVDAKKCTAIFQDFKKYQMTIRQNIEVGVGGRHIDESKINEIIKKVGLQDFVDSLPDGIETNLGQLDKGIELSVGQWQRLAIGRLLANETADIWILDEPTAHLDPLAEIEIYNLIFDLAQDKSVLFISHRLGFAKRADRIIVFDEGEIREEGTHEQLMKVDGVYKEMYELQKEWYL